jgi:hypothetical protein
MVEAGNYLTVAPAGATSTAAAITLARSSSPNGLASAHGGHDRDLADLFASRALPRGQALKPRVGPVCVLTPSASLGRPGPWPAEKPAAA